MTQFDHGPKLLRARAFNDPGDGRENDACKPSATNSDPANAASRDFNYLCEEYADAVGNFLARAYELDDDELDILDQPWRHTDEEVADVIAKVKWRHVKNPEARKLIKTLHEPWAGRDALRAKQLVDSLEEAPTDLFWPVFLNTWPCGRSWPLQKKLLQMLRYHAEQEPAINYMRGAAVEFFDRLPPVVTGFRGCARDRVRGLSWTTSQRLAEQFAVEPKGPGSVGVLATALIDRKAIFAVCWGVREILVDPDHLRELRLVPVSAARTLTE